MSQEVTMSGDNVLGLREMLQGLFHFWDGRISTDGAWWILALNGALFIPLFFAVFFYPMAVLAIVGGAVLLTLGAIGLGRAFHARHPHG
jgi:hypothetical protein